MNYCLLMCKVFVPFILDIARLWARGSVCCLLARHNSVVHRSRRVKGLEDMQSCIPYSLEKSSMRQRRALLKLDSLTSLVKSHDGRHTENKYAYQTTLDDLETPAYSASGFRRRCRGHSWTQIMHNLFI